MSCILNTMSISTDLVTSTPYRERAAWLALVAMGLPFSAYFGWTIADPPAAPMPDWTTFSRFGAALAAQIAIWSIGTWWLRKRHPEDAAAPLDERDRAISRRSIQTGYGILFAATCINIGCVFPFTAGGWKLINSGLASIVVAEVVRSAMVIWLYRRGFHG